MKNKEIVNYNNASSLIKDCVMLRYSIEQSKALIQFGYKGMVTNAMEIQHHGQEYLIIIDDRTLALIEWDYHYGLKSESEQNLCGDIEYPIHLKAPFNSFYYS